MSKFSNEYNINVDNTYPFNLRLTPVALSMFVQDTFARFLTSKNLASFHIIKDNLIWIIKEMNIDLIKDLPFWTVDIKIEIWVSEISVLKVYTDYKVYHNDELIAQGNILWLIIDKNTKKTYRTDKFVDKLEQIDELVLGPHTKFSLPEQKEKHVEITYKINHGDVDHNDHVNNRSYIRIAELTAPQGFEQTHMLKKLKIKFNKETFLDDILTCTAYATETPNNFVHKITKENDSICDIETLWAERTDNTTIAECNLNLIKQ